MGESLVGPSVFVHGTPDQQAAFLPRIISGEDVYCQGFSEPSTGSDLAGLQTKGVVDGDEIVITGQKVWTSGAQLANMMFVLCRTDPDAEKHAGISYVLIDFKDPGISFRPIRQMSGASGFAEDFLDGVRAPLFNVIGGLNNGWKVAMTTLGYERGGSATVLHLAYEREFWELAETARKRGVASDPLIRQQLAWAYTQVEIMRYAGLRLLAGLAEGRQPGPEASVSKLFWSEYHKKLGEIAMAIEGTDGLVRPGGGRLPDHDLAERLPVQPGGHDLLRDQRDPAQHRRRTGAGAAQGAAGARVSKSVVSSAAARELISQDRLAEFFAPRSVALVGASDTSGWARFIVAASSAVGYTGPLHPVHPAHRQVFGRPAVPSLRDLAEPPDLAFILAPTHAVLEVLEDAAVAGVRNVVVLASGYREAGGAAGRSESDLIARAAAHGIAVLGPNCLGFLNTAAKVAPFALTVPLPLTPGPVGIGLQSGALSSALLAFARSQAIGVSTVASLGNEAMITTSDVLDYLVADEQTKVICLFLEEIGDPAAFSAATLRADQAGKPIVALKVGASEAGQQSALAHTGAVAGDDAVVDAVLRQLNIIRVASIEELLTTASVLGYQRVPRGRRMGVLTASGGACDIIADRASVAGLEIPPFTPGDDRGDRRAPAVVRRRPATRST